MKYVKNNFKDDDYYAWGNLAYTDYFEYCIQKYIRGGATEKQLDDFTSGWEDSKKKHEQETTH
jgi:hypothetical protein